MKIKEQIEISTFLQIIDDLHYNVVLLNFDENRIIFQNKAWVNHFGDSIGKRIKDLLNFKNDEEALAKILENPLSYIDNKGRVKPAKIGEFFHKSINRYYTYNTYCVAQSNKKKYKILILIDITEKKLFEIEFENQKKLLDTIIDESPVAIWFYDKDGKFQIINSFIKNNSKYSDDTWSIDPVESKIALENNIEVLKKRESTIKYEQSTFKDGRIHKFKAIRKRIYNDKGESIGVLGIAIDITEIKNAEAKLKYLKSLNELISEFSSKLIHCKVSNIDDFVFDTLKEIAKFTEVDRVHICEFNNEQKMVNKTFEWTLNQKDEQIDNWSEFPFSRIERWFEKFSQNFYVLIPDVSQIPVSYSTEKIALEQRNVKSMIAFPLMYNGELFGYIGFDSLIKQKYWDNDIIFLLRIATEVIAGSIARKNFELRIIDAMNVAEEANKTKSEFLANMSHEIRTPMNAILGFSEILQETIITDTQRAYLNTIISSGRNLMKLINDILDLSKIEAGRIDIMPEPVNLPRIFSEIGKIFEIKIKDKRLEFIVEFDNEIEGYWLFDETRLRQILFNVVGNAIKFTDRGFIKIKATVSENSPLNKVNIIMSIEDSGIGIPFENQKRIFDSFYQVSSKSGKRYDGTGLGLAITMRLIKAMNGEIKLSSTTNKGTNFSITFNDVKKAEITIKAKEEFPLVSKEFSFKSNRFLVVDDINNNRNMIKIFLEEHDGIVLEADNGHDAIKLANFYRPTAIILDIRMPGMSGFEVLHILRNEEKTSSIPVIALTAVSSAFQEKHLYKSFDGVLTKPVRKEELISKLDEIMKKI